MTAQRRATSGSFKKGEQRTKDASAKGNAAKKTKTPKVSEARQLLIDIQNRVPDALEVLDKALDKAKENGDMSVARLVLDKALPQSLVEKLGDEQVAKEITSLREQNQELLRQLAELQKPAKATPRLKQPAKPKTSDGEV